MKKKSLILMWAIIISGTTFLIGNKIKDLKTPTTTPPTQNIIKEESLVSENNPEETQNESTKTFAEHIREGDKLFANYYYKSAISEYKKAIEKNPNEILAYKRLAETYLKNNEPEFAEENFKKALVFSPNSNDLKLGIARAYLNQNNTEDAKKIIWDIPETHLEARYYQGISMILYEKYDDAIKIFNELVKNSETSQSIKNKSENFIKTKETIELYAKDDKLFAKLYYFYTLSINDEYISAIPHLFSIINEKNNYRDAWIVLGYSYLRANKLNEAIDSLIKARDLDPEKAETSFYLGIAYFSNNEIEKAVYYLQKAQSLNFKNKDLLDLKLAEVYNARNDFEKSEAKYNELLNRGNTEITIFENIINLNLEKLNNPKKAFEIAENLYKKHPEEAKTHLLLSKIYINTNNLKHAKSFLNYALNLDQTNPEIYFYMGKISEIENKHSVAKEYYQVAISLGYHEEIAKKSLDRINIINSFLNNKSYQVNLLNQ